MKKSGLKRPDTILVLLDGLEREGTALGQSADMLFDLLEVEQFQIGLLLVHSERMLGKVQHGGLLHGGHALAPMTSAYPGSGYKDCKP